MLHADDISVTYESYNYVSRMYGKLVLAVHYYYITIKSAGARAVCHAQAHGRIHISTVPATRSLGNLCTPA